MKEHIDTRGPWPIWFCGMIATELRGLRHNATLEQAHTYFVRLK